MKNSIVESAVQAAKYLRHRIKPRRSYAADDEDSAASLLMQQVRRFIDIGANDGISVSNTASAALRGAKGLCFEPNPRDYAKLSAFYSLSKEVECIEEGLSDQPGAVQLRSDGLLSAITATEDQGLTKLLTPYYSSAASVVTVKVATLSSWLDLRPEFQHSDLLSIDVEGHELNVLKGIDWARHKKPARCIVVETHSNGPGQQWRHRDYSEICQLLAWQRYVRLAASANNTFWLHQDDYEFAPIEEAKLRFSQYQWSDLQQPEF